MRARAPMLHALASRDDRTERHATPEGLRRRDDVGRHAELLRREPRARAAHSRLDLVKHEERADLRRELAQRTYERSGGRNVAALAEHGFDHDRGDVLRWHLVLEHHLELGEAMRCARLRVVSVWQRARQGVWERSDIHLGEERTVPAAVLGLRRRQARGPDRASVKSAAERDDRFAAGRLTRQLDGPLDRLGTAVAEEHRIEAPRRDRGELLGERDAGLVLRHTRRDVHEPLSLVDDGLHDPRMRVADRCYRDAAGHIEDSSTVGRDEPASLAALDREPRVVAENGWEDLSRAVFEVGHRLHSIGWEGPSARAQPGRRSSPSDVTRICNVARSSPITRTRYPGTPARSAAARRSVP